MEADTFYLVYTMAFILFRLGVKNMNEINGAIITLIGILIGHFITKQINDKNNYLKYITEERCKWREDIRQITSRLYKKDVNLKDEDYYRLLKAELEVRLNPNDEEDRGIIDCFDELIGMLKTSKNSKSQGGIKWGKLFSKRGLFLIIFNRSIFHYTKYIKIGRFRLAST